MQCSGRHQGHRPVALLAEGVDRNMIDPSGVVHVTAVALLAEGVDRNQPPPAPDDTPEESPSSRRAWIEIQICSALSMMFWSPSSRRAWIEICAFAIVYAVCAVALLAEGVDRNCPARQSSALLW